MASKGSGVKAERWLQIGATLFLSESFRTMPDSALKLWIDLRTQFFGTNNGRLLITLAAFTRRGWNSTSKLIRARDELLKRGLIQRTKYCGRNVFHRASMYGFTDLPIAQSEEHGIIGAQPSHAYLAWSYATEIRGFPQEVRIVSSSRIGSSPSEGKREPNTSPSGGKREIGRKPASVLARTRILSDPPRFPSAGDTSIPTSDVCDSKASVLANTSKLNGAHLSPAPAPTPRAAQTNQRKPRAPRSDR